MVLPLTGPLSLSQVNTALGRAAGATISLGDAGVRGLAGVANGAIGLGALRGKSAQFTHTITTHQQELNLHTYLQAQGWDGTSKVEVTVAAGIYIWSDNTTIPALDAAMGVLRPGGVATVVLYTGHEGGADEAEAVDEWAAALPQEQFRALSYRFVNQRNDPPRLVAVEKRADGEAGTTDPAA